MFLTGLSDLVWPHGPTVLSAVVAVHETSSMMEWSFYFSARRLLLLSVNATRPMRSDLGVPMTAIVNETSKLMVFTLCMRHNQLLSGD